MPPRKSLVTATAHYPVHLESDVVLRDGSTVHMRPVRTSDGPAMARFLKGLSLESLALRFFSGAIDVERAAGWAIDVDYRDRVGLVATTGPDARIVAHANYVRTAPDKAEAAFTVADDWQGRGLATIMLGQLAETAEDNGIAVFEASVLPNNRKMLEVFRNSGFQVARTWSDPGTIVAEFPTMLGPEALERFEEREQMAAAAAVRHILSPRSVAVIGASRRRGTISGEVFHNLLEGGFGGPVYPVNPSSAFVQSVTAYPSVGDVPGDVDLAVVVVPSPAVLDAARDCAAKGVKALVVISSGFAEVGAAGRELQSGLLAICRESGMRLIGPNCMGVLSTAPDVSMNATFAPSMPPRGRVGFLSQSGALGLAVIDRAGSLGLGLSSFVSIGNKADLSGNDLISYWAADPETDVVLLYLESFGNPRKFARLTRRIAKHKPIVAVKGGRSAAGARATTSHTGALLAASDVTVDALFRQAGVIRTDTLAELFDVASLLACQPLPPGRRVGIVTNAGGLGILCADACEASGLEVPNLPEQIQATLRAILPAEASVSNPVDMIASASADDYRKVIRTLALNGDVDALIVIFIPPLVTRARDVAAAIRGAADEIGGAVPLLTCFMSAQGVPDELRGEESRIPSYAFPEDAARALARVASYAEFRFREEGQTPEIQGLRTDEAASVIASALAEGPRWLRPGDVARILDCYGIQLAPWRLTDTPEAAAAAADELGVPVAVKAVAEGLVHKTEARAVRLGLEGPDAVRAAAEAMTAEVQASGFDVERFLVQAMVSPGVEMLVGVVHDASFGPVLAVGAGGVAVDLLKDVSVRITPITHADARDMICSLQTFPLLDGYRGAPKADVAALEEVLLRMSALVEHHAEIAELDCNPVIVREQGAVVVDARIRVETPLPRRPLGARRADG